MAKAQSKEEFLSAWNSHIMDLLKLSNNFEGEMQLIMYDRIKSCQEDLQSIVVEAAKEIEFQSV